MTPGAVFLGDLAAVGDETLALRGHVGGLPEPLQAAGGARQRRIELQGAR
ncbi:MAG: hypothetical protein WDN31_20605 [Hyphomicrobium sp.]